MNDQAIKEYADIIDNYYFKLIEKYPAADLSELKTTSIALQSKVKSELLKAALGRLVKRIDETRLTNQ